MFRISLHHYQSSLTIVLLLGHGDAPIHKLRPYLLQLGTPQQLAVNHAQLIDIIGTQSIQETCTIDLENTKLSFASVTDAEQLSIPDEAATLIDFTSAQAGASQTSFACVRSAFRQSLKQHLFGCDETLSMRLRLSLADFAWVSTLANVLTGKADTPSRKPPITQRCETNTE